MQIGKKVKVVTSPKRDARKVVRKSTEQPIRIVMPKRIKEDVK